MRRIVAPDPETLAVRAAGLVADDLAGLDGAATLALAGGSTPRATHARLLGAPIDWRNVTLWLGDERWVPPDHPESNTAMVRETLADHVPATFVAPDTTLATPGAAALAYERRLAGIWVDRGDGPPAPDVVMLGIGDDGHTASLFPDTAALEEDRRSYVANWVETKGVWRLTATFPLLWAARHVVFLAAGAGKAEILRRIIDEGAPYPAQRVAAGARKVTWVLDEAAAGLLRERSSS